MTPGTVTNSLSLLPSCYSEDGRPTGSERLRPAGQHLCILVRALDTRALFFMSVTLHTVVFEKKITHEFRGVSPGWELTTFPNTAHSRHVLSVLPCPGLLRGRIRSVNALFGRCRQNVLSADVDWLEYKSFTGP